MDDIRQDVETRTVEFVRFSSANVALMHWTMAV
jgi:hypothetical protein